MVDTEEQQRNTEPSGPLAITHNNQVNIQITQIQISVGRKALFSPFEVDRMSERPFSEEKV